uniref:sn-1-specific diacylglycerol lipase n=1 Tax=Pyxicephalus adspersus TaxID=30357 RepID=A0AAV3A7H8_PYXAD|nr:TPA: hypothetical protein GDO54_015964 [Pyxicephalus adspersus]
MQRFAKSSFRWNFVSPSPLPYNGWIGIVVLYSVHKGNFDCVGGLVLRSYLIVLIVMLAAIICSLSSIVYVSMQGTISNPGPRKCMPKLVYIRLAFFVPEFVWAVLGAIWVSDNGVQCGKAVVHVILVTVIASWIIILVTTIAVVLVFDPLGRKKALYFVDREDHNLESSQSEQVLYNVKKAATRVWETRIRLLCCCVGNDNDNRVAFSSIAQLFSTYFSDTDLVPSDIAAGLTLLHQEQDKVELSRDPDEVLCESPTHSTRDDLDVELGKAAHYMQFAAAAYGWPLYVYSHPLTGLCKLCGECYSPINNVLIDSHCSKFTALSVKGISQAASYIYRRLINDGILNQAFTIAPEYRLVIVGHSLGAGAAALLAIMLRSSFPTLKCYAFSPPGGLLSFCFSDVKYSARWSKETSFSSIYISPRMITDHMPDIVLNALNGLCQERIGCTSCQTPQQTVHSNRI